MKRQRIVSAIVAVFLVTTSCNCTEVLTFATDEEQETTEVGLSESDLASVPSEKSAVTPIEVQDNSTDESGKEGNLSYTISNGEATITGCDSSASGEMIIPQTLGGVKVTSIGNSAFWGCSSLTSIEIPDSIVGIGDQAFFNCTQLISINVNEKNANYASQKGVLFNKDKTELICVPAGIAGSYIIPAGVIEIKGYAFYGCSSLTGIEIPDGVTSIGGGAFFGCSSLTSISIPVSVTSIGWGAFEWCSSLTSIEIPDGVTSIGGNAFYGCSSLTDIEIPASVTIIGNDAFNACTQLTKISVNENNSNYTSQKGVLLNKDKSKLICVPAGIKGNYIIPVTVVSIGDSSFYGCSSLTGIEIPDSVTSIGNYAFYDCSSLTSMTIPDSVTSMGDSAFNGCNSLTSITIPKSVKDIGLYAFDGCDSLRDIYYAGSEEEWKTIAIASSHDALANVTIHYNFSSPKITVASVKITPDQITVVRGKTQMFSAEVTGENDPDPSVTWEVSGNTSDKTVISKDGVLKVGSDEKSSTLKVEAVSVADTSKSDNVTVTVQMFKDVDNDQFFSEAVNWGTEHNAVAGYSESDGTSSFRPNDICIRAQFVTFLWRTLGEQKPTSTENPFKDISDISSQYYGTALLWAYENHYVSGYSDPDGVRFGPDDQITRGQVVTFLWRAAGEPKAAVTKSPFKDVTNPDEQYYGQAMLWASENGVVSGYSDPDGARFAPDDSCTRGQVVTFLWRYAKKYLK